MFLALNEMKHSKLRYSLILGLLFLISYLVFFLTGLAYGLAKDNREAIDKWEADKILLSTDSNSILNMSMLEKGLQEEIEADEVASLSQFSGIVWTGEKPSKDEKEKVSFFAIEPESFLAPDIVEGRLFKEDNEAVIDYSLVEQAGFKIGDTISLSTSDKSFVIVGYTRGATYSVAPVIYIDSSVYQDMSLGQSQQARVNAFVVRGDLKDYPSNRLEAITIDAFINDLPGYRPQVLTFGFMIGFLIAIAAIVIAIFMYVLTMQKIQLFGVMKAQGIANTYIAKAVLSQTFLLTSVGLTIGALSTWATSFVLPTAVPFETNWLFFASISALMVFFALIGTLFSVRAVVKIDPLKALS